MHPHRSKGVDADPVNYLEYVQNGIEYFDAVSAPDSMGILLLNNVKYFMVAPPSGGNICMPNWRVIL